MRTRTRSAIGLAATALAASLPGPTPAQAGTYPMRLCNVPGHAPAGTGPWVWQNVPFSTSFNRCAAGGGFGFAFPNGHHMEPRSGATLSLDRPSGGSMTRIDIRRARLWMEGRLAGSGSSAFVLARARTGAAVQQSDIWAPPGGSAFGAPWESPAYPTGTHGFDLILLCANSSYDPCRPDSSEPLEVRGADITLSEDVHPGITVTGGPLTSTAAQQGSQRVSFKATDYESGVARVEVFLGGHRVGTEEFTTSRCRYDGWNACDPVIDGTVLADTRAVSDGSHPLQLKVTDAAGNQHTVQHGSPISVANSSQPGGPAATGTAGAPPTVRLSARFPGRRGSLITANWSKRVTIRGTIASLSRIPVQGAEITVSEIELATDSEPERVGVVRSDGRGRFAYTATSRTQSRRLRFTHGSTHRTLRLNVRAATSLKVSLRGVRVRYAGRLKSRPVPRRGKLISMQGRAVGGAWQTFATRRTTRSGRFSGRYRLRVRRPGVRLQFRVRVPSEAGYRYSSSNGRPVTKTVR